MRQLVNRIIDRIMCAIRAVWFLRAANKRGRGIRMRGRTWLQNRGRILVGNRVGFHAGPIATELSALDGGVLEIGDDSMVNYGCSFTASRHIRIGNRCRFGIGVIMTDSHLHREEPERRAERPTPKTITVEDDVWLANRVIVLPGVTLGRGCIVGAGSVVTRSIAPYMLAAGNPARVIRPIALDGRESLTTTFAQIEERIEPGIIAMQPVQEERPDPRMPASSGLHAKVGDGPEATSVPVVEERPNNVTSISSGRGRSAG
ncbi:MAG: acyltransferase [Myxococcales bacterium]